MASPDFASQYQQQTVQFDRLKKIAIEILRQALSNDAIHVHALTGRIKKLDSFLGKIERKQFADPLSEMHDIVGVRVVCLFLSDTERMADLIRKAFLVISEDNKVDDYDASSFGYMSFHFVVSLKPEYVGPHYTGLHDYKFEIQVRTIAMDAWASISHYLDYKSEAEVPKELRRDFYALSALFYVADTHFETLYQAVKNLQIVVWRSLHSMADLPITTDNLKQYLANRFHNRRRHDDTTVAELASELIQIGYQSIGDLDRTIMDGLTAFLRLEHDSPPFGGDWRYSDVGAARVILRLVDPAYSQLMEWTEDSYRQFRQPYDGLLPP